MIAALSDGFVCTVLVLAERGGLDLDRTCGEPAGDGEPRDVQVPSGPQPAGEEAWAVALREGARELARLMPC